MNVHSTPADAMNKTIGHAAALVAELLDGAALALRAGGEVAHAFLTQMSPSEHVASLEVSRGGGDWQRNLIVAITGAGRGCAIEAKITDDEQIAIINVGRAEVGPAELPDVALAMSRAGLTRLSRELAEASPVARLKVTPLAG